jgi:predicted ABC-type ATPase
VSSAPSLQALLRRELQGQERPPAVILTGHNGSGKSTLWYQLLANELKMPLVNADRLTLSILPETCGDGGVLDLPQWAQTLRDTDERWQRVSQSGVRLFRQVIMEQRLPFAFETVFSHWKLLPDGTYESKIDDLKQMRQAGYFVVLIFVGLTAPELSMLRVRSRKALGGHDVPTDKLLERFPRTQAAISHAAPLADLTLMVDNSLWDHQFQFVRAQRKRSVLYDARDPAYATDAAVLAASTPWLEKVAGPYLPRRSTPGRR